MLRFECHSYSLCFQLADPAINGSIVLQSSRAASQCVSRLMTPTLPDARSAMAFVNLNLTRPRALSDAMYRRYRAMSRSSKTSTAVKGREGRARHSRRQRRLRGDGANGGSDPGDEYAAVLRSHRAAIRATTAENLRQADPLDTKCELASSVPQHPRASSRETQLKVRSSHS